MHQSPERSDPMAKTLNLDHITKAVADLKKRYGEKDPERLARAMHILVAKEPMGLFEGCCKGFFIVHRRMKHITVNSDLPEELQRVVIAHELGHAVLHARSASSAAFHDMTLFDSAGQMEHEANLFAGELLLTDEDVLHVLNEDNFFFQAAQELYVPAELLDFKFRVLKRKGYQLNSPIETGNDFMKHLERNL